MAANSPEQGLCASLTPEKQAALAERTNAVLLKLIRTNFDTQYASRTSLLAGFRDAVSAHGGLDIDPGALVQDFHTHVPLSDYESYKPFLAKFDSRPCKESDIENLFAPGLPAFLAVSSATSGTKPKMLAKYVAAKRATVMRAPLRDPKSQGPAAVVVYCGYREILEVEREPGQVVHKIPICNVSGAVMRKIHGWVLDDDENRMPIVVPGYVAPWAAMMIGHHQSSLRIHALFFLACRDVGSFAMGFSTLFVDLIRHMNDQWERFLECIRDGTIPDLEGIEHVRTYLQSHFYASPDRAAELREIGRPFSCEGWAVRVWPNLSSLTAICSGPFATVLPKVRSILGSNVDIVCPRYAASEGNVGVPYRGDNDTFIMENDDVLEFLNVTRHETHENISQSWELEPGKLYEVIMTTKDGLWRYRLGDVIHIIGFDSDTGLPVFYYSGRTSLTLRFPHTQITDGQLLEAIRAIDSEDVLQVQEFTAVVDNRKTPPAVGFFIELSGPLGPNAHLASQKLFEGLVGTNAEHERALKQGRMQLPTIRLMKAGTFAEYRRWKAEKMMNAGASQIKVPVVLLDPAVQEWILEWVTGEL